MRPCLRLPSILHSSVRRVNANNASYYSSFNPQQSSAGPSVTLFKLEDHDIFPVSKLATPRTQSLSDDCSLQLAAHSASKSRSSTPKGWCPMAELLEVMDSLLLERQRARGRETIRRPDDNQRKHRLLNPQRRQIDPKKSSRLLRSLTPHLRAGGKRTTPSRRCAHGSPRQWIR